MALWITYSLSQNIQLQRYSYRDNDLAKTLTNRLFVWYCTSYRGCHGGFHALGWSNFGASCSVFEHCCFLSFTRDLIFHHMIYSRLFISDVTAGGAAMFGVIRSPEVNGSVWAAIAVVTLLTNLILHCPSTAVTVFSWSRNRIDSMSLPRKCLRTWNRYTTIFQRRVPLHFFGDVFIMICINRLVLLLFRVVSCQIFPNVLRENAGRT